MERKENEAFRAMLDLNKAENLIRYNDEIMNWPRKDWFQSGKATKDIRERSKEELEQMRQRAL